MISRFQSAGDCTGHAMPFIPLSGYLPHFYIVTFYKFRKLFNLIGVRILKLNRGSVAVKDENFSGELLEWASAINPAIVLPSNLKILII